MKKPFKNILTKTKNGIAIFISVVILTTGLGTLAGCSLAKEDTENILTREHDEDAYKEAENVPSDDSRLAMEIPQNGQIYGYIIKFDKGIVTLDRQIRATPESEDWKPWYDDVAGFKVVDAEDEDITYPLHEDCTYSILENHHDPVIELEEEEFASSLAGMEYPVLWVMELEEGQIKSIVEQYRP